MQMKNLSKEQCNNTATIISFMTRYKICHFGEAINNHKNAILSTSEGDTAGGPFGDERNSLL
jgi:hypothetical protein